MKVFYQLLVNNAIAGVLNFTVWFAITFYLAKNTGSVLATSVLAGIYLILTAVSSFWLGGVVDRYKKKQAMLYSSIFSLVVFAIGFALYVALPESAFTNLNSPVLWGFMPLLLLGVVAGNVRNISIVPLVTMLVPEDRRDKANGLVGTAFGLSFFVTSALSGFLVAWAGMFWVLLLASVGTVLLIFHLLSIQLDEKEIRHKGEDHRHKIDIKGTLRVIGAVPGMFALIGFTTFNNFLGGLFMSLMDVYGISLVSVEVWGVLWSFLSLSFIVGGMLITKFGLGKSPLRAMFLANMAIWTVSIFFTIQPWIWLLIAGMFIYLCVVPYIEAAEQTIIQKVVPVERQGRVVGFAHSVEQAASPLSAFAIGPVTQLFFIPFMSSGGKGAELIGSWFGVGPSRGIALVFTIAGIIGLVVTILAMKSKYYHLLDRASSK